MPDFAMQRRRAFLLAIALAAAVTWFTGLIPRWGQWYADQPFYRAQVAAFFEGRLALTHHIEGVTHDIAWIDGGVQHVWGLGVPMWLTPFELIGRIIHVTPFPDRLAMVCAMVLMLYVLLRAWFGPGSDRSVGSKLAFLFTAFLPGVIAMLKGRVEVYEEAEAYSYGATMLLFAGVLMMVRRPSRNRYVLLLAFAGMTGLVRPTVWFFGAGTAALATILYIRSAGSLRRAAPAVLFASGLFLLGGAVLYGTNYVRFGKGGEFGHSLNEEDLPGNLYATRFEYPFQHEPLGSAAKELVGGMFGRPEKKLRTNGFYFYDKDLHVWQSPTPRWREYYFTTYTWVWLPMILVGGALGVAAWLGLLRRRAPQDGTPPNPLARESRWLAAWATLGFLPLAYFYLRTPSLSSRYLLDLAPGVVTFVIIAIRVVSAWLERKGLRWVALGVFGFWWGYSIVTFQARRLWVSPVRAVFAEQTMHDRTDPEPFVHKLPDAYDLADPYMNLVVGSDEWQCPCYADLGLSQTCEHGEFGDLWDVRNQQYNEDPLHPVTVVLDHPAPDRSYGGGAWPDACSVEDPDPSLPEALPEAPVREAVSGFTTPQLYRNGTNWDLTTGAVGISTYFFVDDPDYIEVEFSTPDPGPPIVRAKIQLEELVAIGGSSTPRGERIRFAPPKTEKYRHGIQVAFLAFGPPKVDEPVSTYTLYRLEWHVPGRPRVSE